MKKIVYIDRWDLRWWDMNTEWSEFMLWKTQRERMNHCGFLFFFPEDFVWNAEQLWRIREVKLTSFIFLLFSSSFQVCVDNVLKTMKENANKASSILLTAIPQISQMDWAQTVKTLKVSCQHHNDSFQSWDTLEILPRMVCFASRRPSLSQYPFPGFVSLHYIWNIFSESKPSNVGVYPHFKKTLVS